MTDAVANIPAGSLGVSGPAETSDAFARDVKKRLAHCVAALLDRRCRAPGGGCPAGYQRNSGAALHGIAILYHRIGIHGAVISRGQPRVRRTHRARGVSRG